MEIATRNVVFPGSVGLAQAHPLTTPLAMGDGLPSDLVQLRSTLPIRALVLELSLKKRHNVHGHYSVTIMLLYQQHFVSSDVMMVRVLA